MKKYLKIGLDLCIYLLATIFIPDWLISLFQWNISQKTLALIIGSLIFVIVWLIKNYVLSNPSSISINPTFNFDDSIDKNKILNITHVQNLRIYSISSAYWYDIISSMEGLTVDKCTILIRDNYNLNSQSFKNEVRLTIKKWETLLQSKRIKQLTILQYNHISDTNYLLVDNVALVIGTNQFDDSDSTGQHGDRHPLHIFADTPKKQNYIEKYINQFINYQRYYSNNVIYDSNTSH